MFTEMKINKLLLAHVQITHGNTGADPGGVQRVPWNPPFRIALILLDELLLTTFSFNLVNQSPKPVC